MDPVTITALATTATAFLSPLLLKFGEKAAESLGEKLPDGAGKMWAAIAAKFKGKPAAEEAAKDLAAKPSDEDNVAAFRKELKKTLEADSTFAEALKQMLESAQREAGVSIVNTGAGAVATSGGVAAGAGGVAVKGDVHGGITLGGQKPKKG